MPTVSLLKHLDAPVRFLSFTMGELIAYLAPFFVGALLDSLFFRSYSGDVSRRDREEVHEALTSVLCSSVFVLVDPYREFQSDLAS